MSFGADHRSPLAKMLAGPVPFIAAEVPTGRLHGAALGLVALSADEIQRATREAHAMLRKHASDDYMLTDTGEADLALAVKVATVAAALIVLPEDGRPRPVQGYTRAVAAGPAGAEELAKLCEPDEVDYLYNRFLDHQRERSPITTAATWEEVREVVLAMGKGTIPRSRWSGFDSGTLKIIGDGLARELARLTRHSSSDTSPSTTPPDGAASGGASTPSTPSTSGPSPTEASPETTPDTAEPPAALSIR